MKELELLKKYEKWFDTAINYDYISALWDGDFEILIPIYEKWTGKKDVNTKCGNCRLDFMKQLGKLYYKNKEDYEKQSKQTERESLHNANGTRERNNECKGKRNSNPTGQRRQPKTNKSTKK